MTGTIFAPRLPIGICVPIFSEGLSGSGEKEASDTTARVPDASLSAAAVSSSGATGLTQIKNATAIDRAREKGWHEVVKRLRADSKNKYRNNQTLKQPYLNARLDLAHWKWIARNKDKFKCRDWIDVFAKYSTKHRREVVGSYILDIKDYYFQITGRSLVRELDRL